MINLDRDKCHSWGDKETGSTEDTRVGFLDLSLELSGDFVSQMFLFVCLVGYLFVDGRKAGGSLDTADVFQEYRSLEKF